MSSIIDALGRPQAMPEVDTIIIARGGGSVVELKEFDEERLCRATFAFEVPVITSIGHTKHRPRCDHVASAYATVPGRAAELAIRYPTAELVEALDRHGECSVPSPARCVVRAEAVEQLGAELCPRARGEVLANEIRSAIELVSSDASSALASQMLQLGERTAEVVRARQRSIPWPPASMLHSRGSSRREATTAARSIACSLMELASCGARSLPRKPSSGAWQRAAAIPALAARPYRAGGAPRRRDRRQGLR